MHQSILEFLSSNISREEVFAKSVLEAGSLNVNGSPREVVSRHSPSMYIGVDCWFGKDVDIVCNVESIESVFGKEEFDVVISTEMLEHVENWRAVVSQLKRVTKIGGLLIVTTRSPGFPYHPYPIDKWRYTVNHMRRIFSDMDIKKLQDDPMAPGVFVKVQKPSTFIESDLWQVSVSNVR
jgi:SAM-dependent methyltransferase